MIIADRFVFIHLPKTGGTFVTDVLHRLYKCTPDARLWRRLLKPWARSPLLNIKKHGTCNEIPARHRTKPIIACVRNPYDRYVSQFEFGWWKTDRFPDIDRERIRRRFSHFPDLSFEEFIEAADMMFGQLKDTGPDREQRLGYHTEQFVRYFFREPQRVFGLIDEDYLQMRRYKQDMYPVRFMRTDRLNQDLHDCLESLGYDLAQLEFIYQAKKVFPPRGGRSDDQTWEGYYTPELKRVVRRRERLLFALFPEFDV
ncbi:MAG: sulfotransferase family 2 domain-containing protein [Phycisphaerae bacterium]|jgi:hypothetical protein